MDIEALKKKIVILVDTREARNMHIVSALSEMGIRFKSKALKFGDYSFSIDGQSFENICCVERKNSLTEISGNLCAGRMRFEKEFTKAVEAGAKITLLVEDEKAKEKMVLRRIKDLDKSLTAEQKQKGTWRTNMSANSMIASISAFKERYNLDVAFISKKKSAEYIVEVFDNAIDKYFMEVENEKIK